MEESLPILAVADTPALRAGERSVRKLDVSNAEDLALVHRLARERSPVSDVLGASNPNLLMFHCLYTLKDWAYYIADMNVVVFFRTDEGRLTLFDVVGPRIPVLDDLYPYLGQQPCREVRFLFMPDKMGVAATRYEALVENHTHILPPFRPSSRCFVFPFTAHA